MKKREVFKTRYKMKIFLDGKYEKTIKSHDFGYILKVRKDLRLEYAPEYASDGRGRGELLAKGGAPRLSFAIVSSNVTKTRKPRYMEFENLPDWVEHYGINSDNDYYATNGDYSKVVRLRPKKY